MRAHLVILTAVAAATAARAQDAPTAEALHARALARFDVADYAAAADAYESLARLHPATVGAGCDEGERCLDARAALETAAFLRMGLGALDAAAADVDLFERHYRRRDPERAAVLSLTLARALERAGRWRALAERAERLLRARDLRPDDALTARRFAAEAHRALGDRDAAERHAEAMVAAWRAGALDRLPDASVDDRVRRLRARDAIGFALLLLTEREAAALLASRPPARRGALDGWLEARRAELADLQRRLGRVEELFLPELGIAAAERLASVELHLADAVDEALASVSPADRGAPAEVAAQLRRRATSHFAYCAATAVNVRWPSDAAARCRAALSRLQPDRHPAGPHELVGPLRAGPPGAAPPPELDPERPGPRPAHAPR